jgi:hypothetical protein
VAVALAGLLALAGCSAVGGPTDRGPTPTLTPAPVPDEGPSSDRASRPASLREPVDPWRVADAHATTLAGENYTWNLSRSRTVHRPGPLRTRTTTRVIRVANRTTYRVDRTDRGTGWSGETRSRTVTAEYAAGGTVFERRPADGPVRSRSLDRPSGREGVMADRAEAIVARYLATEQTRVEQRTENGSTLYVVTGNGTPPAVAAASERSVTDYNVVALVRPDGRVETLRARWTDGNRAVVTVRASCRAVGNTSVETPAWVTRARDDATATPTPATDEADADAWFVDDEIQAAAASHGNESGESGADSWVGWPAWATDD